MASTQLGNVVSDINTTLNLKVAIGDTSATINSATDVAGVALPTGTYFLTVDGLSISNKNYIKCTLTGTALTDIQSVSPQGVLTSGFSKTHRKGALVTQTDHAILRKMADLLDGTTSNSDMTFTDLSFTGTTTAGLKVKSLTTTQRDAVSNAANGDIIYNSTTGELNQYIAGSWSAVASGSVQPNASATVAGKVEIATSAESIAGTDTGGTGALLSVLPSDIKTNLFTATQGQASVYGADAGGDDTYVVALTPTLASYTTGQKLSFKPTTANTGACTIDFGPGVKNIKTIDGNDPQTGVIRANGVYTVVYDGTSFILQNEDFATTANKGIVEMATDAEVLTATDETRYINPKQAKDSVKGKSFVTSGSLLIDDANQSNITIAHGLGRVPHTVQLSVPGYPLSSASYDGATITQKCYNIFDANIQNALLWYEADTGADIGYWSISAIDSTNITLAYLWSGVYSPVTYPYIMTVIA